MAKEGEAIVGSAQREIVITRVFNAPIKLVWAAWTEPGHLMKWWGPKDFTAPKIKADFRVGGKYHYCMRGPDGQEFWSTGIFREIVPMKKIRCTDSFSDEKGNTLTGADLGLPGEGWPAEFIITAEFEDLGGKTKLTLTHVGIPAGTMTEMTDAGWNQSLDKFEAVLEAMH